MPLMLVEIDVLIDGFGVRAGLLGLSLDRVWAFPDHGDLSLPPEDGGFLTKVCCGPGDRSPCFHPPTVAIAMLCIYPRQRNAAPACSLNRSTRRT